VLKSFVGPRGDEKTTRTLVFAPAAFFVLALLVLITSAKPVFRRYRSPLWGSLNVSRFRLLVKPANGGTPLPVQDINIIEASEKLKYEPIHIPPAIRDKAKIALILLAAPKAEPKDAAKGKERRATRTRKNRKPRKNGRNRRSRISTC
jgi:hypothetical protein